MTDKINDILSDYKLLCEQVQSILLETYMDILGKDSADTIISFNTANYTLKQLIDNHKRTIKGYHKEMHND